MKCTAEVSVGATTCDWNKVWVVLVDNGGLSSQEESNQTATLLLSVHHVSIVANVFCLIGRYPGLCLKYWGMARTRVCRHQRLISVLRLECVS